ncbi:MAG: protein kinase [Ignavibacteriae bacterium]|nr:protein kinase [Ignavibacteriota bacterium]
MFTTIQTNIPLMIGETVSHYTILEKLGEGGMGVVYKARDSKLERIVALKFLPHNLLPAEADHTRFLREAQAAAQLNHPNVCTIHGIEEWNGQTFLVMEYVEGETLRRKIETSALKISDVLLFARHIAEALQEASKRGIVHRDIKSENIIVNANNQLKIMDFGLAKLRGSNRLTKELSTIGTLAYMTPEQLRGEPVDHRADLWSFGVVLYEMISGRLPFPEGLEEATLFAILSKDPAPLASIRSDLPDGLEAIVKKLLAKKVSDRYQTADDVLHDLKTFGSHEVSASRPSPLLPRRWSIVVGATVLVLGISAVLLLPLFTRAPINAIAVLPLENLSGVQDQQYFADGMTEALITNLAQLNPLQVISRTSVMRYKGTQKSIPEIARELNVDAIVEGSVTRDRDRVRITAQLIEAKTDQHLWAQSYDRDLSDILALQQEVAAAIAREVNDALTPRQDTQRPSVRRVNPSAYEALLKGRYYTEKYTDEGLRKGLSFLTEASQLDPDAPQPYASLAQYYVISSEWSLSPHEAMPRVKEFAQLALSRDESMGDAHTYLGVYHLWYSWNWDEAEREFKRAIELNPNSADAYQMYAFFLAIQGRHDESIAASQRAVSLDPLSLTINTYAGWIYYLSRDYDKAAQQLKRTIDMDGNFWFAHLMLGRVLARQGRLHDAIREFQKAQKLDDSFPETSSELGAAYALAGNRAGVDSMLAALARHSATGYVAAYFRARIYAALGEKATALDWLERAAGDRSFFVTWIKVDPEVDILRREHRFLALLKQTGLDH